MESLERFVAGLTQSQFDYLNRNRGFAQDLLDEYDLRNRAERGDPRAQAQIAEIDRARRAQNARPQIGALSFAPIPERRWSASASADLAFAPRPEAMPRMVQAAAFAPPPFSRDDAPPDGAIPASGGVANPGQYGQPAPAPAPDAPRLPKTNWKIPRVPKIGRLPGYAGIAVEIWNLLANIMEKDDAESQDGEDADEGQETQEERAMRCARENESDLDKCQKQWRLVEEVESRSGEDMTEYKNGLYMLCRASASERLHQCNKYGKSQVPLQVVF
jgi:hypothetical protein